MSAAEAITASPEALAEALEKQSYVADDGLAGRMSGAAHDSYWSAPLTLDRHLDRLLDVYAAAREQVSVLAAAPSAAMIGSPAVG